MIAGSVSFLEVQTFLELFLFGSTEYRPNFYLLETVQVLYYRFYSIESNCLKRAG